MLKGEKSDFSKKYHGPNPILTLMSCPLDTDMRAKMESPGNGVFSYMEIHAFVSSIRFYGLSVSALTVQGRGFSGSSQYFNSDW